MLRRFLQRKEVYYDSRKSRRHMANFLRESGGWKLKDLAILIKPAIEAIGGSFPIKLVYCHGNKFLGYTDNERQIGIDCILDTVDGGSMIHITYNGKNIFLYVNRKDDCDYNGIPEIFLRNKWIKRADKEVRINYSKFSFFATLRLQDYLLEIEVILLNFWKELTILRNFKEIEEYLFGLNHPLSVDGVYEEMKKLLGLSKEDISKCYQINISYDKIVKGERKLEGKILLLYGETQEYAIRNGEDFFHLFANGSWIHLSDNGIERKCIKEENMIISSIKGDIEGTARREYIDHETEEIARLRKQKFGK